MTDVSKRVMELNILIESGKLPSSLIDDYHTQLFNAAAALNDQILDNHEPQAPQMGKISLCHDCLHTHPYKGKQLCGWLVDECREDTKHCNGYMPEDVLYDIVVDSHQIMRECAAEMVELLDACEPA